MRRRRRRRAPERAPERFRQGRGRAHRAWTARRRGRRVARQGGRAAGGEQRAARRLPRRRLHPVALVGEPRRRHGRQGHEGVREDGPDPRGDGGRGCDQRQRDAIVGLRGRSERRRRYFHPCAAVTAAAAAAAAGGGTNSRVAPQQGQREGALGGK